MSTEIQDIKGGVSNCCSAEMYEEQGVCSDCKEHCENVEQECVGCSKTEGLVKCEGTMCLKCWEAENEEPEGSSIHSD